MPVTVVPVRKPPQYARYVDLCVERYCSLPALFAMPVSDWVVCVGIASNSSAEGRRWTNTTMPFRWWHRGRRQTADEIDISHTATILHLSLALSLYLKHPTREIFGTGWQHSKPCHLVAVNIYLFARGPSKFGGEDKKKQSGEQAACHSIICDL